MQLDDIPKVRLPSLASLSPDGFFISEVTKFGTRLLRHAVRNSFAKILPRVVAAWSCLGRTEFEMRFSMVPYISKHLVRKKTSGSLQLMSPDALTQAFLRSHSFGKASHVLLPHAHQHALPLQFDLGSSAAASRCVLQSLSTIWRPS